MKKLITLFLILIALSVGAFAQTNHFSFQVTPQSFNASVSKYVGGNVWLSTPITIVLPPGTAGTRIYRVYTPVNRPNLSPITFGVNTTQTMNPIVGGYLQPGTQAQVFINLNVDQLTITNTPIAVPITILDETTNFELSIAMNLSVVDDRTYTYPTADTRVVPHLATGFGWRTVLQFTNPNDTPSVLQINFFDSTGASKAFRLRDGRYSSQVNEIVAGKGTSSIVLEDITEYTITGSAEIVPLLNQPVGITVMYVTTDAAAHIAALPGQTANTDTITLFYDNTNDRKTGLVLCNSLNYAEPVTITYYDDGGAVLATQTITLPAKGQTAFVVGHPKIANRMGVITASMPFRALSGFVLRFDKDMQFIPVTPF